MTCTTIHAACRRGSSDYHLARLVDVGTLLSDSCRLCITTNEQICSPYVTLSHFWRSLMPIRSFSTNLDDDMTTQIDIKVLSRTFQEAVETVHTLDIRYLRGDSLCIMQDSSEYWQKEASAMKQGYWNAFCCLAATGAQDSTDDLYLTHDPRSLLELITEAPLNQRAWVYQEQIPILSRSTLHFTKTKQIFWECRKSTTCETLPYCLPWLYQSIITKPHERQLVRSLDASTLSASDETLEVTFSWKAWAAVVSYYSGKQLKFRTDLPIAISGIARLLGKHLRTSYVA
ncbi:HET-domain-containing protein [Plenodomus tracheiphilus IPT5]|uniref:HET-domain-containing protein n=1 Tax=Plenodomus tracheiphilus IPT5 TaxID=1408161 RepID=A0A6A7BL78_9PLEO|nr:HET-domain-containing protein [Plenodomus tracheiphilus IPT5]